MLSFRLYATGARQRTGEKVSAGNLQPVRASRRPRNRRIFDRYIQQALPGSAGRNCRERAGLQSPSHQTSTSETDQKTDPRLQLDLPRISGPSSREAVPDFGTGSRLFHEQWNGIDRGLSEVRARLRSSEIPRALARSVIPWPHLRCAVGDGAETVSRTI